MNTFNAAPDNSALLIVRHLREVLPRLEVPMSITSDAHVNSIFILGYMSQSAHCALIMALRDPKRSK